jgi:hypothetical protein
MLEPMQRVTGARGMPRDACLAARALRGAGLVFAAMRARWAARRCSTIQQPRSPVAQGDPAGLVARGVVLGLAIAVMQAAGAAGAAAGCDPHGVNVEPAGPMARRGVVLEPAGPMARRGVVVEPAGPRAWRVVVAAGEAAEANRGLVAEVLAVADGHRLWLLNSGPSPGVGAAIGCALHRATGRTPTDLVATWPHPEAVLGAAAWPQARHWAHADVADAMRERCPACVERLRARLGTAGADLGADLGTEPIRVPERRFVGASGRLGPFDWWRLERAPGTPLTVWWLRGAELVLAPGLLWPGAPPDLRETDIGSLRAAWRRLEALAPAGTRWLGEQGGFATAATFEQHRAYLLGLESAVAAGLAAGADGLEPPPLPAFAGRGPEAQARHRLNWQRAWRHAEDALLRAPAPIAAPPASAPRDRAPPSAQPGTFQRSLR